LLYTPSHQYFISIYYYSMHELGLCYCGLYFLSVCGIFWPRSFLCEASPVQMLSCLLSLLSCDLARCYRFQIVFCSDLTLHVSHVAYSPILSTKGFMIGTFQRDRRRETSFQSTAMFKEWTAYGFI
jgi:hypothetical protein